MIIPIYIIYLPDAAPPLSENGSPAPPSPRYRSRHHPSATQQRQSPAADNMQPHICMPHMPRTRAVRKTTQPIVSSPLLRRACIPMRGRENHELATQFCRSALKTRIFYYFCAIYRTTQDEYQKNITARVVAGRS